MGGLVDSLRCFMVCRVIEDGSECLGGSAAWFFCGRRPEKGVGLLVLVSE